MNPAKPSLAAGADAPAADSGLQAVTTDVGAQRAGRAIRVAVVEEQEIFRRGLVASLAEDPSLQLSVVDSHAVDDRDVDIAVVSSDVARRHRFSCPLVVCGEGPDELDRAAAGNDVAGMVPRRSLTVAQLHATVHATAAGLRVAAEAYGDRGREALEPRARQLLQLMADGYTTREIAERMCYSERTIKKLLTGLEVRMKARSRAHIVALAIRRGLI